MILRGRYFRSGFTPLTAIFGNIVVTSLLTYSIFSDPRVNYVICALSRRPLRVLTDLRRIRIILLAIVFLSSNCLINYTSASRINSILFKYVIQHLILSLDNCAILVGSCNELLTMHHTA